jgi:hypothetical protein
MSHQGFGFFLIDWHTQKNKQSLMHKSLHTLQQTKKPLARQPWAWYSAQNVAFKTLNQE